MAAGTLSVTNNSTAVVGVGTTFTALKAGDFLSLVVGQVPYTIAISSIESDTALTLTLPFDGPTVTGLAWDGIKRDTMSLATMGVTVQAQKALRLMIADENNWRAIFGDAEEITVTLPNGQVMQGMSWGYLSQLLKNVDPVEMRDLAAQAEASKSAAQGFRNEAEGFKNTANSAKDTAVAAKTAAETAQGKAEAAKTAAETANTDAQAASTAAQGFRDQAEEWAQSVNADNLLTKSGNLAGLTDKPQAWLNVRPDGATPLAGDPVGDYDAATKRWVQNLINTGTVGPTLNGVMNYGVGDFHLRDSRAYLQPYEVASDGQLLNRADWPELWAYAQMLSPISDAAWLANTDQRGKYSTGNGTTTFRVPDRNGTQDGSLFGLFGRGDGGQSGNDGYIYESGAPNIVGTVVGAGSGNTGSIFQSANGSFAVGALTHGAVAQTDGANSRANSFNLNASRSSPIYGRTVSELRPNNFMGVWVIRASGGFVAANTSWSVINGDATKPPSGTTTDGGSIVSEYRVGTSVHSEAKLRVRAVIGDVTYARLAVTNLETAQSSGIDFNSRGEMTLPGKFTVNSSGSDIVGSLTISRGSYPQFAFEPYYTVSEPVPNNVVGGRTFFEPALVKTGTRYFRLFMRRKDGNRDGEITLNFPTTVSGTIALQGTSGREYKKNIADADASEAMDRIASQRLVNFVYKDDEKARQRFGIIAEEAELIAPQYVKHHEFPIEDILDEDGNKIGEKMTDRPSIDVNPIVMDLMGCVQYLNKQVEELKAEIAALKK